MQEGNILEVQVKVEWERPEMRMDMKEVEETD